jgi:hypothetical protein
MRIFACSDSSLNGLICKVQKTADKERKDNYQIVINEIVYETLGIEDSEFIFLSRKKEQLEYVYREAGFLSDMFNISNLYIRQQNLLNRNENVFEKTLSVIKLLDRIKPDKEFSKNWTKNILEDIKPVLNDPLLIASYSIENDIIKLTIIKNGDIKEIVVDDQDKELLLKLKTETPAFENLSPEKSLSKNAHSYGILPFYFKNKIMGLYFEYTDYRIFSQREIELFFFIAKSISSKTED